MEKSIKDNKEFYKFLLNSGLRNYLINCCFGSYNNFTRFLNTLDKRQTLYTAICDKTELSRYKIGLFGEFVSYSTKDVAIVLHPYFKKLIGKTIQLKKNTFIKIVEVGEIDYSFSHFRDLPCRARLTLNYKEASFKCLINEIQIDAHGQTSEWQYERNISSDTMLLFKLVRNDGKLSFHIEPCKTVKIYEKESDFIDAIKAIQDDYFRKAKALLNAKLEKFADCTRALTKKDDDMGYSYACYNILNNLNKTYYSTSDGTTWYAL